MSGGQRNPRCAAHSVTSYRTRKMSKPPQTAIDWAKAIHAEFQRESDRAAGIVAGAMLDDALLNLLRARLVPSLKSRSLVDAPNAPLGSFSARIDAAHQLGLISEYLARDLHLIRRIRNEFAHASHRIAFDAPPVRDFVHALQAASDYNRRHPHLRRRMGLPGAKATSWGSLLGCCFICNWTCRKRSESRSTALSSDM